MSVYYKPRTLHQWQPSAGRYNYVFGMLNRLNLAKVES